MAADNIWRTCEADAFSRAFDYKDYLSLCENRNTVPVSKDAYALFVRAFDRAYTDDQSTNK